MEDVFRLLMNMVSRTFRPMEFILVCVPSFKMDPRVFYFKVAQRSELPGTFAD